MAREYSVNYLKVIENVELRKHYNDLIVPLDKRLRPIGTSGETICPFHQDTDPSLHIWGRESKYHCFGCGFTGDAVTTYIKAMKIYKGVNLEVNVVLRQLAKLYNIELDEEKGYDVSSVFDRARKLLLTEETYIIPKSTMTLAEYTKLNNQLKGSKYPERVKVDNFNHIDLVAALTLSSK